MSLVWFDPEGETKVVAAALYSVSALPDDQLRAMAERLSADDRAALDETGAADLASALIKVGTASARLSLPELGMSFVPETDTPVSDRVRRLQDRE